MYKRPFEAYYTSISQTLKSFFEVFEIELFLLSKIGREKFFLGYFRCVSENFHQGPNSQSRIYVQCKLDARAVCFGQNKRIVSNLEPTVHVEVGNCYDSSREGYRETDC